MAISEVKGREAVVVTPEGEAMEGVNSTIGQNMEAEAVVEVAQLVEAAKLATSGLITLPPVVVVVPGQLRSEFGSYAFVEVCYFIVLGLTKIHRKGCIASWVHVRLLFREFRS